MPETSAGLKAQLARLWDAVGRDPTTGWPTVTHLTSGPPVDRAPEGFDCWLVGPNDPRKPRSIVVLPALVDSAPLEIRRRYFARAIAQGAGRCPLCSEVADIHAAGDPEHGRAAYHHLPVTVGVVHTPGCPAIFEDKDRRWFEPPTGPSRPAERS